jgi:hypothetical protein
VISESRFIKSGMKRSHMKKVGVTVSWVCVFSTLSMGCYSSALIDPRGNEKDKLSPGTIEYVIMNDSTKCEFDNAPIIVKDAIIGQMNGKEVTLPLSDVALVYVKNSNPTATTFLVLGMVGMVVLGVVVVVISIPRSMNM